jgi:hypothetical protein
MSGALVTQVFDSALPRMLKPIAAALATFADDDGTSMFPSVARVAWMLGVHPRHARRAVSALRAMGVLVVRQRPAPGRTTRYYFDAAALPERPSFVARQLGLDFSTDFHSVHRTSEVQRGTCTSPDPSVRSVSTTRTKSSARIRARGQMPEPGRLSAAPLPRPLKTQGATHRQLLKLAHLALEATPALVDDEGALVDALKWKLAKWNLSAAAAPIARAAAAAVAQSRHLRYAR